MADLKEPMLGYVPSHWRKYMYLMRSAGSKYYNVFPELICDFNLLIDYFCEIIDADVIDVTMIASRINKNLQSLMPDLLKQIISDKEKLSIDAAGYEQLKETAKNAATLFEIINFLYSYYNFLNEMHSNDEMANYIEDIITLDAERADVEKCFEAVKLTSKELKLYFDLTRNYFLKLEKESQFFLDTLGEIKDKSNEYDDEIDGLLEDSINFGEGLILKLSELERILNYRLAGFEKELQVHISDLSDFLSNFYVILNNENISDFSAYYYNFLVLQVKFTKESFGNEVHGLLRKLNLLKNKGKEIELIVDKFLRNAAKNEKKIFRRSFP